MYLKKTIIFNGVECYHLEDKEVFEKDMKAKNEVVMSTNGSNSGTIMNFWTYYGGMKFNLSENIILIDNDGNKVEDISVIENDADAEIEDIKNYQIILKETLEWDSQEKQPERKLGLYIFCPVSDQITEPDYEDEKFAKIYNEIKSNQE